MELGHPEQLPCNWTLTTPSLNSLNLISPPSLAIAGRIFSSSNWIVKEVYKKDILDYFDPSRAKSKDAILAYLYNHLRNFYSSIRTKEIRYAETKKRLKEVSTLGLRSNSNLFGTKHDEDTGCCHDIKRVGKAFVKSLKGLEKKAWKMFIHDEASADAVAKEFRVIQGSMV